MRLFVGVDVGGGSATAPDHLTLAFLGDGPPERVPALAQALAPVAAGSRPFDLVLAGWGAFPDPARPRVVWIGVRDGAAPLTALAHAVRAAIARVGAPRDDRPFHPHLTVLRVRGPRDLARARALLDGTVPAPPPRRARIDALLLKESTLAPAGPVHRTIGRWALAGAGPAGDQPAADAESATSRRQR